MKFNFKFNLKSFALFETLTGKSFFKLTEMDLIDLFYSVYIVNNPQDIIDKDIFISMLENKKVLNFMLKTLNL